MKLKKKSCVLLIVIFALAMPFLTVFLSGCDSVSGESFVLPNGQPYTASGYLSESNGEFEIADDFEICFDKKLFKDRFNRILINYSSDKPLHIFVKYRQGLISVTDEFYLDAGDDVTFGGLIAKYVKNRKANTLYGLTIRSCDGSNAKVRINSVSTEKVAKISKAVYYLENARYKIGINLKWGGGISYIEDKADVQSGLGNLINSHDTGRLIQQSYYGTFGNDEYTPGESFYQTWPYNPVQGGDQFGNASRLIDFTIENDRIYIKSQPQDWAQKNKLTRSYMENTYYICEDYIKVDNRFIDYSGWEHPKRGQELPAFYTVSYLDHFVFYNGDESWTDGELTVKSDLPFWGPYADQCTFTFEDVNTERWCAWVSDEINYGIGIYVPNVEQVCAGRYEYDGSKSANANSTNYVSPGSKLKIISFEPIEYSYMITCGSVDDIRSTFKANRDFATNAALDNFARE